MQKQKQKIKTAQRAGLVLYNCRVHVCLSVCLCVCVSVMGVRWVCFLTMFLPLATYLYVYIFNYLFQPKMINSKDESNL